jgi:threonyl-tRNA synthetase
MKKTIQTVKGTREFYPEAMSLRNYLFEKVRTASQAFGYQEYDGPLIEPIDLYPELTRQYQNPDADRPRLSGADYLLQFVVPRTITHSSAIAGT